VPGAAGQRARRPAALTRALALSPTATSWAAATTEGLLVYALDPGLAFDPTDLTEDLTPRAFHQVCCGVCATGLPWCVRARVRARCAADVSCQTNPDVTVT
jgi:hypothetical protein